LIHNAKEPPINPKPMTKTRPFKITPPIYLCVAPLVPLGGIHQGH